MSQDPFLDDLALHRLTGRKHKSARIAVLRAQGIPFYINAMGEPIVARSVIEGRPGSAAEQPPKSWRSNALNAPGGKHGQKANRQSHAA